MNLKVAAVEPESLDLERLRTLFGRCQWDWLEPSEEMKFAFECSYRTYVATEGDAYVGFARIISDGKIYGLLVDCMVEPSFRRQGVGASLVDFVVHDCRERGLKVIQLLASRGGMPVYERAGFQKCPESSPGMVKFLKSRRD